MFLEREWEPPGGPPDRKPTISAREERMLLRLVVLGVILSLIAPIGGASLVQAIVALF
ncbi:hypothetical protein GCM10011390_30460 [Aureimonas endophytica]|uniref:Uncharacterized protein n=1 Tax=Aureimonas endophytica TaxID=2027858 RepID=A0A916ZRE9_9HYPH|nr:hypothetical protein [Aureimonas endophytica]GGE09278.1 hypothetical protein GCM10011390_30460 [Aureimonas endophytica]